MKYSAINIGPIFSTLGMARRPRELWAASFLFSHLMKCIYAEAEKAGVVIISPAKPKTDKNKVGVYPDRIYFEGEIDIKKIITNAACEFYCDLFKKKKIDLSYFNLMSAFCDAEKDSVAISILNQKLDILELCNYATDGDSAQTIYNILSEKTDSPLFDLADGKFVKKIKTIEDIAKVQREEHPEIKEKSHHRYFCVVQADGDNIGKTVSHKGLSNGKVLEISNTLVDFGIKATNIIDNFGGLPIYAGGDDLLFIAPVIGKDGTHIFNLLEDIENKAFKGVHDVVDTLSLKNEKGEKIEASLSYGVSICYYKYPLYEALESARTLLFGVAKNIEEKKAIACCLRKHSGGTFDIAFSLKNAELKQLITDLMNATVDNDTVSAIAHKLRLNKTLVDIVLKDGRQFRLNTLFEKILEFDTEKEKYFDAVKKVMPVLYKEVGEKNYCQTLYSLLRITKFIKGEELHDE